MASSAVGRASSGDSPGASSMAAAFRGEVVCECEVPECSPCPIGSSGHGKRHWHVFDRIARKPIVEVSTWSRRTAETIAATMELTARPRNSPASGKGTATGMARRMAQMTISEEVEGNAKAKGKGTEEAEGNAKTKGKGTGKRKVPRAAAEAESQFPKKSPRIGTEFQAVLPPLPPLGPRPGWSEDKCRKAWGAPADAMSEEDKSMDLFMAQLLTEFRADIPEDEILETLCATEEVGTGYPWFASVRATLAQKVAAKAQATAATAAAAANTANVASLWTKAAIAGAVSISKIAIAAAASEEALNALSSGEGAVSAGAPSAAVPSAEAMAASSSGASPSSEAADSSSA